MPVREALLLVLPDREIYDYLCTGCSASLGHREVSSGELMMARASSNSRVRGGLSPRINR
jgi:hypothetical protein